MHIGLLEDDLAIQELLRILLQGEGHDVVVYPSARACLVDLRQGRAGMQESEPDLLLIDLRLANSASGLSVIEEIRLVPRLKSLPIILMTASATLNRQELERLHIVLLPKPFDVDEVTRLVDELTRRD